MDGRLLVRGEGRAAGVNVTRDTAVDALIALARWFVDSGGAAAGRMARHAAAVPGPATLQNSYSLVSRQAEGDLAEVLFRERMSLLAYSPLAGGFLTGKYRGGVRPEGSRFARFDTLGARFRKPIVLEAVDSFLALAERRGLSPVQLALGYVRSRHFIGAQILGATTLAQLDENLNNVLEVRARNGARSNRMESALGRLGQIEDATRSQLSDVEDADIAKTLIELSSQTAAYQSALKSGANLVQSSLMDFLR